MQHSPIRLRARVFLRALAILCLSAAAPPESASAGVTPLGTAFTYQGLLKSGGSPANGTFHLRFQLWNALAGGAQLGSDLNFPTLSISNGLFTASLDFGSNVFDGSARWLQVQVVTNGGATVTTLTPRQPVTAAPYALRSAAPWTANGADIAYTDGNVGIGTPSPATALHIKGTQEGLRIDGHAAGAANSAYISFRDSNGTETANIGDGSFGDSSLYLFSNAGDVHLYAGGQPVLTAKAGGNVGIGTASPLANLHVVGSFLAEAGGGFVPATVARQGSDGILVSFFRDLTNSVGSISVAGSTVSYNAFTGSHYGWTDRAIERGTLVVMTGENRRRSDDPGAEPIYGVAPSTTPNDSRCLGAYLGVLEPGQPPSLDNPHQIMAVGNGDMWVVDSGVDSGGGRNIQPGDYLISSDVEGHAMLDDPQRFPIGHVIARAAEAVDWADVTESVAGRRVQRISVFFENFERGSAADAEIASLREENDSLRARLEALESLVHQLAAGRRSETLR